jgi:hypothetical protein
MSRSQELFDRLIAGGEAEVLSFIAQPVTEELFLDYKRSADNGAGSALHNRDRSNLAKAISGFGNSEGGVLIWGVDCRNDPSQGDIPTGPVRIQNPIRFKSWLEQATTGLTVPAHEGVRHHAIAEGFVVTLIPSGMHAPYQAVGELSYYIRAGSNFAKTPHAVLAGMFGRRPQSSIKHRYLVSATPEIVGAGIIKTQIGFILHNFGRGIARDVFINLSVTSHPGRNCEINFQPSPESEVWWGRLALARDMHLTTRAGYVVPPEAYVLPVSLEIKLQNPIEDDFSFQGTCGSSDGEPWRFQFKSGIADIVEAFDQLSRTRVGAPDAQFLAKKFNKVFFKEIPNA